MDKSEKKKKRKKDRQADRPYIDFFQANNIYIISLSLLVALNLNNKSYEDEDVDFISGSYSLCIYLYS